MVLHGSHENSSALSIPKGGQAGPQGEAPSPFLDGTSIQYAWDATSLDALKKCPRYYQYTLVDNWKGKGDNIHLRFGIEVHQAIEDFEHAKAAGYKHFDALHLTIRALIDRIDDWDPNPTPGKRSEVLKSKENLVRTVVWYLDHYEDDAAKTVILDNGKPAVELTFAFELPFKVQGQNYMLCGHLDKLVRYSGDLYVMDHKTSTTTLGASFFNSWDPNNQMTVYTIASQTIMKSPIKGVIVDGIQVADSFIRPVRSFTMRAPQRLDEWLQDLGLWLEQARYYAKINYWPQNDTACSMYGGCVFREVCSKSPAVRETFLKSRFTQEGERWNPLKPR